MFSTALACLGLLAQAEVTSPVHYVIRPVERETSVELIVDMSFRPSTSPTVIALPSDRYGTHRMVEFIREVGVDHAEISAGTKPHLRVLEHDASTTLTLRYVIAFDPAKRPGAAYRPAVGPAHFHFLGPQWQAKIDAETSVEREFSFEFADVPDEWETFGSFGVGAGVHRLTASWDDLVPTVLGGGDYEHDAFEVRDREVHTFVHGAFAAGTTTLFESVRKIVTYQRDFFADYDHELLVVTLTARDGLYAGTSILNSMVCFADPDGKAARIERLLAHEMFHQWLPRQGTVEPGDFDERFDWIDEGFTEYFARRLMLEQDLVDMAQFVEWFNRDLRELAENEHRAMTEAQLRGVHARGEFTNRHYRLSYLRGALIALDWNAEILRDSDGARSLSDCVREFIARAKDHDGKLPRDEFYALMTSYGVDAKADVERWTVRAEPIVPHDDAFGAGYLPDDSTDAPRQYRPRDR